MHKNVVQEIISKCEQRHGRKIQEYFIENKAISVQENKYTLLFTNFIFWWRIRHCFSVYIV